MQRDKSASLAAGAGVYGPATLSTIYEPSGKGVEEQQVNHKDDVNVEANGGSSLENYDGAEME